MSIKNWWPVSVDEVKQRLQTDAKNGLSSTEAKKRLQKFGYNKLPEQKGVSAWVLLLSQFSSFIVWILIGALVIAGALGEWIDALSIGIIVFFNAVIGFVQEYSAERSVVALRKLTHPISRVIRDGVMREIPSEQLVPGDLIVIEAGDKVPADGRIVYSAQLSTQEAALTGESMPVEKIIEALSDDELPLGDRKNMTFMGTIVVRGKGYVIVTGTGLDTELGNVASLLQAEPKEKTPLQVRLEKLGHRLVGLCFFIVAAVFVLGLLRGTSFITVLLTSLSLAVAAIPEGLPAIVTIAFAIGMRRMVKRNALIRRLPSVETLGSASVICTDKTGTLTQNKMTVRSIWVDNTLIDVTGVGYAPEGDFQQDDRTLDPQDNEELMLALKIGVLCNNAELTKENENWDIIGDPVEGALLAVAAKAGLEKKVLEQGSPLLKEVPFDSQRKRMSVLRDDSMGRVLFVKGAPDIILDRSEYIMLNGKKVTLTQEHKQQAIDALDQLASQALRVLGFAYRDSVTTDSPDESFEENLIFVGLIAMIDPPRPEVKAAIATCKKAGIRTVMITGDHKQTAIAIAKELDLIEPGLSAIDGVELERLSDEELQEKVRDIVVYARASVEHKMRIIKAWKSLGEVVAMTGDGVNDAPAIKAADIGISMGITGTEVAKEASDMIILDDNFASIVNAVEEGRGIYDNIVKFVNYLLSSNIAELLVIFMGTFFGFVDPAGRPYVSLVPVQLLWINLVTDGFVAIALGVDPLDPRAMERPPRKPSTPILTFNFASRLFLIGLVLAVGAVAACHFGLRTSAKLGHTMAFTTLVVLELVRVQMVRSQYHVGLFSNGWLIIALGGSLVAQLMVIYVPFLQTIFRTVALGGIEWLVIIAVVAVVWLVSTALQLMFKKWNIAR